MPDETEILVESVFGVNYKHAFVNMRVGETQVQMMPQKAREVAMLLLEVSESSEQDSFLAHFLMERAGVKDKEKVAMLLADFRSQRGKL